MIMAQMAVLLRIISLARIIHELATPTVDMNVLPGVLGPRTLRRTVQVRLGFKPLWLHTQ